MFRHQNFGTGVSTSPQRTHDIYPSSLIWMKRSQTMRLSFSFARLPIPAALAEFLAFSALAISRGTASDRTYDPNLVDSSSFGRTNFCGDL